MNILIWKRKKIQYKSATNLTQLASQSYEPLTTAYLTTWCFKGSAIVWTLHHCWVTQLCTSAITVSISAATVCHRYGEGMGEFLVWEEQEALQSQQQEHRLLSPFPTPSNSFPLLRLTSFILHLASYIITCIWFSPPLPCSAHRSVAIDWAP